MDTNSKYIIQPRGKLKAKLVDSEKELFDELDKTCAELKELNEAELAFPPSIGEINLN